MSHVTKIIKKFTFWLKNVFVFVFQLVSISVYDCFYYTNIKDQQKYIKHEIKNCHTRNTMLCYVCDMLCYMSNTTNIITKCNSVTNISQEGTIIQS